MARPTDRTDGTGAGGGPPLPPELDLVAADEGPMRGDLKRQIAALEHEIAQFVVDNCPFEPLPVMAERGPAILTTEQLEYVRDELLAVQRQLHDRAVSRMAAGFEEPELELNGILERLRRRLRRLPGQ